MKKKGGKAGVKEREEEEEGRMLFDKGTRRQGGSSIIKNSKQQGRINTNTRGARLVFCMRAWTLGDRGGGRMITSFHQPLPTYKKDHYRCSINNINNNHHHHHHHNHHQPSLPPKDKGEISNGMGRFIAQHYAGEGTGHQTGQGDNSINNQHQQIA
jgi:hypothetical protein